MEQVPDAELARDVTPRADPMLVLLQMRVQGTSDQQIVSVCWDQQFGNYWYFSRGVGHPAHGVLAVARKMTDGFIADYPPSHATSYYLKADGVHIVRNGVDDETHGTVPDVSGAPGLICADLATLPAAMSDQVNGDVPPCAPGTVLPWS
jgi:hypothetical protein